MSVQKATITLASTVPKISVTGLIGPNGVDITDGYGGWELVERLRRQSATIFKGRSPFKMTLHFVMDAFVSGISVEGKCTSLERLALPPEDGQEPPVIKITGAIVPHRDLPWVIENLTWEDVERNRDGSRIRQVVTIELRRYLKPTMLPAQKASARARTNGRSGSQVPHQ